MSRLAVLLLHSSVGVLGVNVLVVMYKELMNVGVS
jgi:hypothetical protein